MHSRCARKTLGSVVVQLRTAASSAAQVQERPLANKWARTETQRHSLGPGTNKWANPQQERQQGSNKRPQERPQQGQRPKRTDPSARDIDLRISALEKEASSLSGEKKRPIPARWAKKEPIAPAYQAGPSSGHQPSLSTKLASASTSQGLTEDSNALPGSTDTFALEADSTEEGSDKRRTFADKHRKPRRLDSLRDEQEPVYRPYVKNDPRTHNQQQHPRRTPQQQQQRRRDSHVQAKLRRAPALLEKTVRADVYIPSVISVGALAQLLNVKLEWLQRRMKTAGMADETSYDHVLTSDYAVLLAEEFGRNPIVNDELAFNLYPAPPHPDPSTLPLRPPVVTIMGHVDHGKTTLLDNLRSSSVAKGEAGGITQHIGAFSVPVPGTKQVITFLDTPGHAAFSAMRARGARVTDIVVLVVAADDGVMPQTKEVINLIKQDPNVGVVVAMNKMDKPGVDPEFVQTELMAEGIQLETMNGDVPVVSVSGLTGLGLPTLVETLSTVAEMKDLRAEPTGPVHGHVLESKVHKGLGPVATVLVLRGSLKAGAHLVSGTHAAKVRVMSDSSGKPVKLATPGTAVIVSGWKTLPSAGDEVLEGSEGDVKKALANRLRKAEIDASLADVEAINASRKVEREKREEELRIEAQNAKMGNKHSSAAHNTPMMQEIEHEGPPELKLIIKADVSGSAEAVVGALSGMGNQHAMTRIVSSAVGEVTESDLDRAKIAGGTIVAFSVPVSRSIQNKADSMGVSILASDIIYRIMDDVRARVIDLLPKIIETSVLGEATVLELFEIKKSRQESMKVAGCRVGNGVVQRSKRVRLIREGETIYDGTIETLRHHKKDVDEIKKGMECGMSFKDHIDVQPNDFIQVYTVIEKPGVL